MAEAAPHPNTARDAVPIQEIIFSCGVCQATPSEVYATVESNHGFHSGSGEDDGIVTKMWIAECSHVSCSKHFEDGAIPFHPQDQAPKALCPTCIEDNGDKRPKELYSLRGVEQGQYDSAIPIEWFQCPPMKLDTSVPGMSAVRFQYVALSHYARKARIHWKQAESKLYASEKAHSQERKVRRLAQANVAKLEERVQVLEQSERQLQKWEGRKPMISHYLDRMGDMAKELRILRGQLRHLGYDVPEPQYTFEPYSGADEKHPREQHPAGNDLPPAQPGASPTIRPPVRQAIELENSSSARKRKREHFDDVQSLPQRADVHRPRGSSRDLMPPPLPRLNAVRPAVPAGPGSHEPPASRLSTFGRAMPAPRNTESAVYPSIRDHGEHNQATMHAPQSFHTSRPWQSEESNARRPLDRESDIIHHPKENGMGAQGQIHGVQPFSRLSINSPPRPQYRFSGQDGRGYDLTAHGDIGREDQNPQPFHHNPAYRNRVPKHSYDYSRDGVPSAERPSVRATPSPRKRHIEARPANSVISPFFKRGSTAVRAQPFQRPPAGARFARPVDELPSDAAAGYYSAGISAFSNPRFDRPPTERVGRPPSNDRLYRSYERPAAADLVRGNLHVPPPPSNARAQQGLQRFLHRPEVPSPRAPMAPPVQRNQQRILLPPSNYRPIQSTAGQDYALSQIHGVRGVGSQRGVARPLEPMLGSSRDLFSAAGARRSVRR
ncbi:uncharacterized protein LTR77_010425 [Saxophila tyrrhenica]|uniref:Uncharacterized protein n=1 Tax=Saxophila tyrrhenica TaxID=1690608 RepID=A0AAV9NWC8_9PEZI|nr:hypothetical protein LTR77_010425 [Saxophila tyrrhenica]